MSVAASFETVKLIIIFKNFEQLIKQKLISVSECFLLHHSKDIVLPCEPGYFSTGGKDSCDPCPRGYKCPSKDGSSNQACLDGEYAIGAATTCTACPKGSACPNTTTDYMIKCEPGFYALARKTECTPCRAGL